MAEGNVRVRRSSVQIGTHITAEKHTEASTQVQRQVQKLPCFNQEMGVCLMFHVHAQD